MSPHPASTPAFPDPPALAGSLRGSLPDFGIVEWLAATESTNADLMRAARNRGIVASMPWLEGAHLQTAGRGRAGRVWENRAGDALMFSCAFSATIPLTGLPGLSPALGVAACEALREVATIVDPGRAARIRLKWPNDLQFDDGKLAGILVETSLQPGSSAVTVVAGIGLNLRGAAQLTESLGRAISDWATVTDCHARAPAATEIVRAIAQSWQRAVRDYSVSGYARFQSRFERLDALAGAYVEVIDQGRVVQGGNAAGTDAHGRLILATPQGRFPVLVGDISVRPRPGSIIRGGRHDHSA